MRGVSSGVRRGTFVDFIYFICMCDVNKHRHGDHLLIDSERVYKHLILVGCMMVTFTSSVLCVSLSIHAS